MFNLSKIDNKKLNGNIYGKDSLYSISFIETRLDWFNIPVLEKMAKANRKTLDKVVGVLASYGQIKSDVTLLIFINPINEDIKKHFEDFLSPNFLKSESVKELLLPILGAYGIKGGDYEIKAVEDFSIKEVEVKALRVIGEERDGLGPVKYSDTVLVPTKIGVMVFDLILMDKNEPKKQLVTTDFESILQSLKVSE